MGFIYLPTGPQKKHANFSNTKETQKHLIYQKNSNTYLYPKRFDQSQMALMHKSNTSGFAGFYRVPKTIAFLIS